MSEALLIWPSTVEALFLRALKGKIPELLRDQLRHLGIDLDKPLLPAYPWETWLKALDLTSAAIYPQLTLTRGYFELGQLTVTSYQDTLVGKAMFAAVRVLPTRRVLERMTRNFRTSNNFTQIEMNDLGPGRVEMVFNRVEPIPTFTEGVLAAGLPAAGIPGAKVSLVRHEGEGAVFLVEWKV